MFLSTPLASGNKDKDFYAGVLSQKVTKRGAAVTRRIKD